jgi:hypothetical protein
MAIKTPHWAAKAGAYPHHLGWVVDRPKGRVEVVRKGSFTAEEIAEWHGEQGSTEHTIQTLHEAPHVEVEVEKPVYEYFSTFAQGASSSEEE